MDGRQAVMSELAHEAAEAGRHFFYVRLYEPLGPLDRGEKYEDPLAEALGDLGEVTGGGSQLGDDDTIEFCGIDIVVEERDRGLKVLRETLTALGADTDTVIEEYVPEYRELSL